jgi:hypothetical protein
MSDKPTKSNWTEQQCLPDWTRIIETLYDLLDSGESFEELAIHFDIGAVGGATTYRYDMSLDPQLSWDINARPRRCSRDLEIVFPTFPLRATPFNHRPSLILRVVSPALQICGALLIVAHKAAPFAAHAGVVTPGKKPRLSLIKCIMERIKERLTDFRQGAGGGLDTCRSIWRIKSGTHAITPPGLINRVFGSKAWHVHGLHYTSHFSKCNRTRR